MACNLSNTVEAINHHEIIFFDGRHHIVFGINIGNWAALST